jgi:hypothetical protein
MVLPWHVVFASALAACGHLPYTSGGEIAMADQDAADTTREVRLKARASATTMSLLLPALLPTFQP